MCRKTTTATINLHLLFFLFLFISCSGQKDENFSKEKNTSSNSILWQDPLAQFSNNDRVHIDSALKIGEYVREIFQDKNNNIWFGTLARGVARYDGKSLTYFSKKQGLIGNQINGIAEDQAGNIWFATTEGVSKFDGRKFINYNKTNGLRDNSTWSILVDTKGSIWVGTLEGLSVFDEKKFSDFHLPKVDIKNPSFLFSTDLVWDMSEDYLGNIWFGTDGVGLVKYDGKSFTHFTKKDGLNTNDVMSVLADKNGNIWAGCVETRVPEVDKPYSFVSSGDGGLSRLAVDSNNKNTGNKFTQITDVQGFINKDIAPIYEDKSGNIWIGAKHNGAYIFDGKSFSNYREEEGIAYYNCVQSFLEDKEGNIWVGFSGGLFRLEHGRLVHITTNFFN